MVLIRELFMKLQITKSLKGRIFAALIAAGVTGPSAYVATQLTVPSEGVMTHLHLDPVGKPTTCIGHLVKKNEVAKQNYTIDECIAQFAKDWKEAEDAVDRYVKVPFRSEWMKGALTDFTFNKGAGNFASSTMLKDLNNGNYDRTCRRLTDWVYGTVNGKKVKLKGLEVRASKQYKYCMGEIPAGYKQTMEEWSK
jgi:lysozyme